jgi:hypothetical protein
MIGNLAHGIRCRRVIVRIIRGVGTLLTCSNASQKNKQKQSYFEHPYYPLNNPQTTHGSNNE